MNTNQAMINLRYLQADSEDIVQKLHALFEEVNKSVINTGITEVNKDNVFTDNYTFTMSKEEFEDKMNKINILIRRLKENICEIESLLSIIPNTSLSLEEIDNLKSLIDA